MEIKLIIKYLINANETTIENVNKRIRNYEYDYNDKSNKATLINIDKFNKATSINIDKSGHSIELLSC